MTDAQFQKLINDEWAAHVTRHEARKATMDPMEQLTDLLTPYLPMDWPGPTTQCCNLSLQEAGELLKDMDTTSNWRIVDEAYLLFNYAGQEFKLEARGDERCVLTGPERIVS